MLVESYDCLTVMQALAEVVLNKSSVGNISNKVLVTDLAPNAHAMAGDLLVSY